MWRFVLLVSLVQACNPTCKYCSTTDCLICNDPNALISGKDCTGPSSPPPVVPGFGSSLHEFTYTQTITTDASWVATCTVSDSRSSEIISYWEDVIPIWVSGQCIVETCTLSKVVSIGYAAKVASYLRIDDAGYLTVNDNKASKIRNYYTPEIEDITSYFAYVGNYLISIEATNTGGDCGAGLTLTITLKCYPTCSVCSQTGCSICNDPNATVSQISAQVLPIQS